MDSNSWKEIIDGLDEDIVDAAAERLSNAEHSIGETDDFPDVGKTVEYKYPANPANGKKRRGHYIGIGSAAAAAVVAGVVALNNSGLFLSSQPTLTAAEPTAEQGVAAESAAAESVSTTPFVVFMEKSTPDVRTELISIQTDGIDFDLFEKYFYGSWLETLQTDDDSMIPYEMELSYSSTAPFGVQLGNICVGTILTDDGCYLLTSGSGQNNLWFVPQDDTNSLIVYYDVQIVKDMVVYEDSSIKCDYTQEFIRNGTLDPAMEGYLGYFGQEKLAQEMGLTTTELFEKVAMSESTSSYPDDGSAIFNWERTTAMTGGDIWLVSKSDEEIVLFEKLVNVANAQSAMFEITWTNNGEWHATGYARSEMSESVEIEISIEENGFNIFDE